MVAMIQQLDEPVDPFDIEGPSPLPRIAAIDGEGRDPVATAERRISEQGAETRPRDERVAARLALSDAWLSFGALAPALEAVRQAAALLPDDPGVLERLAQLLARSGAHREAGESYLTLARASAQPGAWLSAGRSFARAEATDALQQSMDELLARMPDDLPSLRFVVEALRAIPGNPGLVERLVGASKLALRRGDAATSVRCAVDAWVESRGAVGGEPVAEVLLARGDAPVAFAFAVDAAFRAMAAGRPVDAAPLCAIAARAARAIPSPAAETAVYAVAAVLHIDAAARENVRDLLAEQSRLVEFAARLRAGARRETDPVQAGAAWKGVAAIEAEAFPARAADALGEALVADPADVEALDRLEQLAGDPNVTEAVRDALAWASRLELGPDGPRRTLLMRLGALEERSHDPAAAMRAYSRAWKAGESSALARIEALTPEADAQFASADALLAAAEKANRDERATAVSAWLDAVVNIPGAVRDLAAATRVLAPVAGTDERAAAFWVRLVRRGGDAIALSAALRRIAMRASGRTERVAASVALAELLDRSPEGSIEAVEALQQALDEHPGQLDATATLVAIGEHVHDDAIARAVLHHAARIETDSLARDTILRMAGDVPAADSPFAIYYRSFDEAPGLRERAQAVREVLEILGPAPALLARRTRALLAQPNAAGDGLESAQRFAQICPLSPEATIAWFGASGIAGDPEQLAEAAIAVVHSLASARDAASVARAAVTRLFALDENARGLRVAREAAAALGLADRALRATLTDYAQQQPDAVATIEILEAAVAGSGDAPGEQLSNLRRIAHLQRQRGQLFAEAYALRRLLVQAPADHEALTRLSEILPMLGDERALARVLSLQLASETDRVARRDAYLTLAALQARSGDNAAAAITLDRYADESDTLEARAEVVRALHALGASDQAVERLTQWAARSDDARVSASMYRAAARISRLHGGETNTILALARAGLQREPESPELLLLAEEVATDAKAMRSMLEIYDDLDAAAAGEHGRAALAYRRAAFLDAVGEHEHALATYLALFDKTPSSGALVRSIDRLSESIGRHDVRVSVHRRLAEVAVNNDGRVSHYLAAMRIAREQVHDRRAALELALLAHDVKRDADTAREVIEVARSIKPLDTQVYRSAVETVVDRTLQVADEVWDDAQKRDLSLRAAEIAAAEIADAGRLVKAVETYFKGAEDKAGGRVEVTMMLDRIGASAALRAALTKIADMREAPAAAAPPTFAAPPRDPKAAETIRTEVETIARSGDRAGALAKARDALAKGDDEALRQLAEQLARDCGDAAAELALIDHRLDRVFDNAQRRPLVLRSADLLSGPLDRPEEARRRLEIALASEVDNPELLRSLHDVVERLGAWDAVASLLERRIARASERAEIRALRLHRAAVLEQRLENPAGARAELEAILDDEPAHRAALRYLADLHLRDEQYRQAGECFARAAATTPVRSEAAELLATAGDAFARGDEAGAAEAQYRRAVELDPRCEKAVHGLSEIARQRGDWGALERTLLELAEATEHVPDRVALRLAAARAALEAGALYRAKSHLDGVRKLAPADEVAQLDAVLQDARDNDRPISRPNMRAVQPPAPPEPVVEPTESPAEPVIELERKPSASDWLAPPRDVPRTIDPEEPPRAVTVTEPEGSEEAIPLVSRPPRKSTPLGIPATPPPDASAPRKPTPPPSAAVASATEASAPRKPTPPPFAAVTPPPTPAPRKPTPPPSDAVDATTKREVRVVSPAPVPPSDASASAEARERDVGPLDDTTDDALREMVLRGDADAMSVLSTRLSRSETGRAEALKLERQRFNLHPSRLDALGAMVGLYRVLNRGAEARAVQSVLDVLSGSEANVAPPPLTSVPEPPADAPLRMFVAQDLLPAAEIGSMLWEALGNVFRRDLASYGVTGVDRVPPTGSTEIARIYASAARVLQLQRTSLFIRAEVPGGALPARTQPPSVILAAPLANDAAVSRYMLGAALEATRASIILACTLDPEERATLVRGVSVGFGASGVMAGAPPAAARLAQELIASLAPRAQRRLQELVEELDRSGMPFTEERWLYVAEIARARAGLLVSGDFGVAARMVVARHRGGGEPDVKGALGTLEPLRDLARFAVSDQYLLIRWQDHGSYPGWR